MFFSCAHVGEVLPTLWSSTRARKAEEGESGGKQGEHEVCFGGVGRLHVDLCVGCSVWRLDGLAVAKVR